MPACLPQASDTIAIASQLGRFDLASLLLTVVALLIAILALPVFSFMKFKARQAAVEEVRALTVGLDERVEREAISKMEEMLPTLVEQYNSIAQNSITAQTADDIAGVQSEGDDGNNLSGDQGGPATGA